MLEIPLPIRFVIHFARAAGIFAVQNSPPLPCPRSPPPRPPPPCGQPQRGLDPISTPAQIPRPRGPQRPPPKHIDPPGLAQGKIEIARNTTTPPLFVIPAACRKKWPPLRAALFQHIRQI